MAIKPGKIDNYRWLPYVIFFLGCCFVAVLLSGIKPDVFFSGDAGLKYLVIKQINSTGVYKTLQVEQPSWVYEIWSQGFYPFKPPFFYQTPHGSIISFPPAFQWINAPFYNMFDYKGIYIVPCLSILLLWVWLTVTLQRSKVSPFISAAALFLLAFCSPVTLYAAVYWEHSLATLLLFSGVVFLVKPPMSFLNSMILGLLAGLTVWFRPEALVFDGLLILAVLMNHYRKRNPVNLVFVISTVSIVLAFFIFNKVIYGNILGAHSYQLRGDVSSNRLKDAFILLSHINARMLIYFPSAILFCALAIYLFLKRPPMSSAIYQLTAIILLFSFLTPFILPNAGGKQWGPRYFIIIIPVMATTICLAASWISLTNLSIRRLMLPIILMIVYSLYLNVYKAAKTLIEDYAYRVTPGLQFLKEQPVDVVVVQNQYIAQEFATIFERKKIFLTENQQAFEELAKKLKSAGVSEIIYIASSNETRSLANNLKNGSHDLRQIGDYFFGKYNLP